MNFAKMSLADLAAEFYKSSTATIRNALSSDSFRCKINDTANEPLEILIYGIVGDPFDGIDARSVAVVLSQNKGRPVNVRINSPGGLAFDGLTIFNALVGHDATVTTTIEGLAASAAGIIALAGKPVRMLDNGSLFLHRAMGLAMGNRDVMLDVAAVLEQVDASIVATVAGRRGLKPANVSAILAGKVDGTTFGAEAAKSAGLIDEIVKVPSVKNDGGMPVPGDLVETAEFVMARARRDQWLADARRKLELHSVGV